MDQQDQSPDFGRFDLNEIAKSFPETAETLLVDTYLTNEQAASARVFRVYRGTPPHYHATCDEYLYVLSGKGTFWMDNSANGGAFAQDIFSSSSAARSTPCPTSSKARWCSCRSTRQGATPRTSSSSIPRTAHQKASFKVRRNEQGGWRTKGEVLSSTLAHFSAPSSRAQRDREVALR